MAIPNPFKDTPGSVETVGTLRPNQTQLQDQVIGGATSLLGNLGTNQFNFAPIEQQARENFQKRTIPSIAERFTGQGGGLRSSAFQGALGGSASDLETNLAALKSEYGLRNQAQQQSHLSNLLGYGLQPAQENIYSPPQESGAKQLLEKGADIGGELGKAYIQAKGTEKLINALKTTAPVAAGAAAAAGAGKAATAGTTAALTAGIPFLPIAGGLAAAAVTIGLGVGLAKLIKNKRTKSAEAQNLIKQLEALDAYQKQHPDEFGADFPVRGPKEAIDKWGQRIDDYRKNKEYVQQFLGQQQPQQGGQ